MEDRKGSISVVRLWPSKIVPSFTELMNNKINRCDTRE